ncbi:alpha/beta hydrolase [Luteimonas sp. BDR2-5]|uniref:esterase/lipase family protein n=1 Tax=Proluteimonas luteida TaxID=2878685 RepID=UPI001E33C319|nr:alpha/beta fold hydrolase [Luteimonas sp. BDR2-5]MCD9029546.1 alpha/beta hydrolase [Luteimonas sp. BDR2-5]
MPIRISRPILPRLLTALVLASTLGGCAILREFKPAVELRPVSAGEYIAMQRGDILTSGQLSAATTQALRTSGLEATCAQPSPACIDALSTQAGLSDERRLSALSELWLQRAMAHAHQSDAGDEARMQAWMEAARHAYAYLFFTSRQPGERAFEDRQTQARDWYNHAVEQASTMLFGILGATGQRDASGHIHLGDDALTVAHAGWTMALDLGNVRLPEGRVLPDDLLPASSLSFAGVRSVWRRDGFGAELVAVTGNEAATGTPGDVASTTPDTARKPRSREAAKPAWTEMPSPGLTVLFQFAGDDLEAVLATRQVTVSVHDPYVESSVTLRARAVPLAANYTAGYGLWLARSGFSRQSLRTLFGRENGIDRPHLYMLQPWDPERRVILLVHGLASSPEAWVDVANELQGDETLREHFQIWLAYYPTNLPIALNHARIRTLVGEALQHFDPDRQAVASRDMVVIGHSMGGVIARLMVSSADDQLWAWAATESGLDPQRLERLRPRLDPALRFGPFDGVSRAIFIAAPHRGTVVAGRRPARMIARLVRMPLTVLESFDDLLQGASREQVRERLSLLPNSIDNLREDDPFVQTAADLPLAPGMAYHSIVAQRDATIALQDSDDGLVPYRSAHLPGAISEKVVIGDHSIQGTAESILEIRRILHEDLQERAALPPHPAGPGPAAAAGTLPPLLHGGEAPSNAADRSDGPRVAPVTQRPLRPARFGAGHASVTGSSSDWNAHRGWGP